MQFVISGIIMLVIDFIYLSLTAHEFKDMVKNIRRIEKILGNSSFGMRVKKKK